MRHRSIVVVAAAALVWGCGNSSTAPTPIPGQTASCSVTLSGSIAGTFDCRPAIIGWASASNTSGFGFSLTASATQPAVVVSVSWAGRPAVRTYASSDSGAQGIAEVLVAPGVEWLASVGGNTPPQGSYALTLTSVTDTVVTARGQAYLVAGTLTATLGPVATTGASGAITINATF
jgi:hypothetical protein